MPHLSQEQIESANRVDLAGFLLSHGERLKNMGSQRLWEKHQVWVDGYRWYSHYDSKGGYAVSFVMRYFDMDFQSAVRELIGEQYTVNDTEPKGYPKKEKQGLEVPPKNATMQRVYAYLMQQRFIARDIISYFARQNLLYEDAQYHNCIFVGLDDNGTPKHFHRRSTVGKFKQTITGSEAEYSFHYDGESEWLFVFEAPIDMLAFLTIHQNDWQKHSYVALCSVSERALLHRLEANPNLKKIVLCLDHDNAGIAASVRLKNTLTEHGYTDIRIKQPVNKDWDEDVRAGHGIEPIPAEADMSEKVREICHEVVMDAALTKIPTMLRERTFSLFDKMCNNSRHPTSEQFEELTRLLLMNAKEECRKCLEPKEWSEIEKTLSDSYVSYADNGNEDSRFRQLMTDMNRLRKLYEEPALINDSERFLEPILKAAMDCIRYINYENGKEQKLYPNLEYACASGMSFITSDTKGDLYRHYGKIAKEFYGYKVAVIDLRNPTKSDGNNLLHLVNKYMDLYKANPDKLVYKAKAEKYAKIIAKTIILSGMDGASFGQNSFFYDAAEGLIVATVLLVAEFCPPETRHIVSVFKIIQDLLAPAGVGRNRNQFQVLMSKLPEEHKAKWFAGAALNTSEQAMSSVMSTALSRLLLEVTMWN